MTEDGYETIKTQNEYDIAEVLRKLPPRQQPELVVVRTDAIFVNCPRNLAAVQCPKVLLFGDTHHGDMPIRKMLSYVANESYDYIVIMYDKHHMHWLKEAGHDNVYYIPSLEVEHVPVPFQQARDRFLIFIGQLGERHPRRARLVQQLATAGYPISALRADRSDSAAYYARASGSLNVSLNGDLNMRVFEILDAGGFLLTDRLSPQSGLSSLFAVDEHLVCYDSFEDLCARIDAYASRPEEALAIARRGYEHYRRRHLPEHHVGALLRLVTDNVAPDYGGVDDDPRWKLAGAGGATLLERASFYESLQEMHRRVESLSVLCVGTVRLACDIVDLPRLRVGWLMEDSASRAAPELFRRAGVDRQIRVLTAAESDGEKWDVLVTTAARFALSDDLFLRSPRFQYVMILGLDTARRAIVAEQAARYGYRSMAPDSPIFMQN